MTPRSLARLLAAVAPLLLAVGCSAPLPDEPVGPRPPARSPGGLRQPDDAELRDLLRLSEVVVLGEVEERLSEPRGVFYRVRVREVLHQSESAALGRDTHPCSAGSELRASSFWYRPGRQMAEIGELRELSRYLLFLSPGEAAGEWLHLDDAAGYPLPECQPTVDRLKALRGQPGHARRPG